MIRAKKSLGQNFLKDKNICLKIVNALEIESGDIVIEIGPGTGALTDYLIENDIDLKLIEIDDRAIEFLEERYKRYNNYEIIRQSIIDFDFEEYYKNDRKIKVIGNIPYYISGRIFFKIFENAEYISRSVLTVQKEVAERVVAQSGNKDYGILTVAAQLTGNAEKLFNISPGSFIPPPKVTSATVRMNLYPKISQKVFKKIMNVVKIAFNQRRKMLSNSLKGYLTDVLNNKEEFLMNNEFWAEIKNKRPEQLTEADFIKLHKEIDEN
jgi:16S rRNA (adenine1518-N6/adenine1519-N6)-dimethyltransferase